jgi:ribosomal protein S18 acetylase RimI-like enzyme
MRQAASVAIRIQEHLERIDWEQLKHDLAADDFDNGRSGPALRRSFQAAQHVAMAVDGERCVGTARLLADGVCNAYLVDVWTASSHRRQGIGRALVQRLIDRVPGQHIGLQVDSEAARRLYESMGFRPQPEFMALVPGRWLDNEGNS